MGLSCDNWCRISFTIHNRMEHQIYSNIISFLYWPTWTHFGIDQLQKLELMFLFSRMRVSSKKDERHFLNHQPDKWWAHYIAAYIYICIYIYMCAFIHIHMHHICTSRHIIYIYNIYIIYIYNIYNVYIYICWYMLICCCFPMFIGTAHSQPLFFDRWAPAPPGRWNGGQREWACDCQVLRGVIGRSYHVILFPNKNMGHMWENIGHTHETT